MSQNGSFRIRSTHDVHRFLAISEAIAHLDYAESEGKVGVEMSGGVEFYRPM